MFDLPCPKRFLRLSTALLAMVTYRCMLPPIPVNRRVGENNTRNKTYFPGVRVLGLILFCFCICFVLRIMYCATLSIGDWAQSQPQSTARGVF